MTNTINIFALLGIFGCIVVSIIVVTIASEYEKFKSAKKKLTSEMMAVYGPLRLMEIFLRTKVYFVGGIVRDEILRIKNDDIDIVVDVRDISLVAWFVKNILRVPSGTIQKSDFQTITFPLRGYFIDAVIPRSEEYNNFSRNPKVSYCSLNEDAKRRDFCCNALYMDLDGVVVDPTRRGFKDVKTHTIHLAGDPKIIFSDDPVRILRAIRFQATKGFNIDSDTWSALMEAAPLFKVGVVDATSGEKRISPERVQKELKKIFTKSSSGKKVYEAITLLHKLGITEEIFPELEYTWYWNQHSVYHQYTLSEHTLRVLSATVDYANEAGFPSFLKEGLCLAAIYHDCAKRRVRTWDGDYCHYIGHDLASAVDAEKELRRLRYSLSTIGFVKHVISHHMDIKSLVDNDGNFKVKTSTFLKKVDELTLKGAHMDWIIPTLCLMRADDLNHSTECKASPVDGFIERYINPIPEEKPIPRMKISGHVVMAELGLTPSPELGAVMCRLNNLRYSHPDADQMEIINIYKSLSEEERTALDK